MKIILRIIHISFVIIVLTSCQSDFNEVIVREFIQAENDRDSIKMMRVLHDDFTELFEHDTTIASKKAFADSHAWGKEMDDKREFEIIKINSDTVTVLSNYFCERDKLLKLGPYESTRSYIVKDGQVFQVIEKHDEQLFEARNEVYMKFLDWLQYHKKLSFSDFPFSRDGATRLKTVLKEYVDEEGL